MLGNIPDDLLSVIVLHMLNYLHCALKPTNLSPFRGQNDYIPRLAQNEVKCMFKLLQCCKRWHSMYLTEGKKYRDFWAEINKKTGHDAFLNWKCVNPPSHKFWEVICVLRCHTCKQFTPAPIRKGFVLRMCAWCFQHCTVSELAVARCFPHHVEYFKHLRRDFTWIDTKVIGWHINLKQKLHAVFLLQDIAQLVRELPPYEIVSNAIENLNDDNESIETSNTA